MNRFQWLALLLLGATSVGPISLRAQQPQPRELGAPPVRPGDRIIIWLFDRPSAGAPWVHTATVGVDGQADLPLLGRVALDGLPVVAAQDTIRARLRGFLQPGVGAVMIERRVVLTGAIARPDVYYLEPTITLREAVGKAGGVTDAGDRRRLLLRRDGVARELRDWQESDLETLVLHSGDQLIVPKAPWIKRNAFPLLSLAGALATVVVTVNR